MQAHFVWPRGTLLVIGLLIRVGTTAEGAMALARFAGDGMQPRFEETLLLSWGATVAALAMVCVLASAPSRVTWVGLVLVAAGLAPVAPIRFEAARRLPGVSTAATSASVTSIGYSAFVLGLPLMGAIATASSLSTAMGVVVVAALVLACCAGGVVSPRSASHLNCGLLTGSCTGLAGSDLCALNPSGTRP